MESQNALSSNRNVQLPTTRCPNCSMIWIAPGLSRGDTYECKRCHLSFVVCEPSAETLQRSAKAVRTEHDSPHDGVTNEKQIALS